MSALYFKVSTDVTRVPGHRLVLGKCAEIANLYALPKNPNHKNSTTDSYVAEYISAQVRKLARDWVT